MPQVPVYSTPQVSPNEGLVDPRGYATPQAFGAGVGREITGFGNQIEKASDVLAKHAMVLQDRLNQSTADQAVADYVIAQSDLDQKQRALEGKARFDNYQNYIEQSQKLREKMAAGMPNIEARRLFDNETRRYFAYSVRNEANGVGTELKRYNIQSSQRVITVANGTVANAPGDDGLFAGEEANVRRAVAQQAEIHSWTPEEKDFQEKEALSNLWATRIQQLAQDDPERANAMFEQNKDRLNVTDRQKVQVGLAKGQYLAGSRAEMGRYEIQQQITGDIQSIYETGQSNPNLTYAKVRAAVGEQGARDWVAKRKVAYDVNYFTGDIATITPDVMLKRLNNLAPTPGSADFAHKSQVREIVEKAYQQQIQMRISDPARSVEQSPVVQEVLKNFVPNDPATRALLIDARMSAQHEAGIEEPSPITAAEARELAQPLKRMLPGQESETLEEMGKRFQTLYGDHWKDAFRYTMRVDKQSSEANSVATQILSRVMEGQLPTASNMQTLRRAVETDAIQGAISPLTPTAPEYYGDPMMNIPMPAARQPQPPLSKRILQRYGTTNGK